MSSSGVTLESEAGRLQANLRDVFAKLLTHTKRIDSSIISGASAEALGQVRELEQYLDRGLAVLGRPLNEESPA